MSRSDSQPIRRRFLSSLEAGLADWWFELTFFPGVAALAWGVGRLAEVTFGELFAAPSRAIVAGVLLLAASRLGVTKG